MVWLSDRLIFEDKLTLSLKIIGLFQSHQRFPFFISLNCFWFFFLPNIALGFVFSNQQNPKVKLNPEDVYQWQKFPKVFKQNYQ